MMLFPFFSVTFLSLLCPKYITVCLHVGGGKVKVYLIIRSDYVDQDLVFIRGNVQKCPTIGAGAAVDQRFFSAEEKRQSGRKCF